MLKEQWAQEAKRRQSYILRSARAGQELKQLRQTLGDSLRHIAQDPVDPELLENETRMYFLYLKSNLNRNLFKTNINCNFRLDTAVSMSLPPTYGTSHHDFGKNLSPRAPY